MQYGYKLGIIFPISLFCLLLSCYVGLPDTAWSSLFLISGALIWIAGIHLLDKVLTRSFQKRAIILATLLYPFIYHIASYWMHDPYGADQYSFVQMIGIHFHSGEILVFALLGCFISLKIHQLKYTIHQLKYTVTQQSPTAAWIKSATTYIVILLSIELLINWVFVLLGYFSIQPDFTLLSEYDLIQVQVIISLLFSIAAMHILAHFLTATIQDYLPSYMNRIKLYGLSLAVFLVIHLFINPQISIIYFGIGSSIYILLMDLYTENKQRSITWVLIWLIVVSGLFTTIFIAQQQKLFQQQISSSNIELLSSALSKGRYETLSDNVHFAFVQKNHTTLVRGLFHEIGLRSFDAENIEWTYDRYSIIKKISGTHQLYFAIPQQNFNTGISLFTIFFAIGFIFIMLIGITNSLFHYLPEEFNLSFDLRKSMKNRLQMTLIGTIIFSFVVIGFTTVYYIGNQNARNDNNLFVSQGQKLLGHLLHSQTDLEIINNDDLLSDLGYIVQIFNGTGGTLYPPNSKEVLPPAIVKQLQNNKQQIPIYDPDTPKNIKAFYGITGYKGQNYFYLIERTHAPSYFSASSILNTLIKVYVFLFLIAFAIAITIANSITWPLIKLSDKLKNTTFGDQNQALDWPDKDEIGELIQNYNAMLNKLHHSANLLAKNEREMAWREMAKQVAHEIKNPLTPMKLSIQYLQLASKSGTHKLDDMIKKVSATMIEQIDNLTRIATEFSTFATMPNAQNEKIVLNEVVVSVHNLFRKREDLDIQCYLPMDEIYVFADKDHLIRIMNNLIKNAIQAIPTDQSGEIFIRLKKLQDMAIISVQDNGIGIPEDMKNKIFEPNFTTKSSGTGLGLAMCANMINGFNGKIHFESKEGEGATFFVKIPMMRLEDNYKKEERVSL